MLSTTPCMMPTKGSLRPKSVVKVTMRLSGMHWQSSRRRDGSQAARTLSGEQRIANGEPHLLHSRHAGHGSRLRRRIHRVRSGGAKRRGLSPPPLQRCDPAFVPGTAGAPAEEDQRRANGDCPCLLSGRGGHRRCVLCGERKIGTETGTCTRSCHAGGCTSRTASDRLLAALH